MLHRFSGSSISSVFITTTFLAASDSHPISAKASPSLTQQGAWTLVVDQDAASSLPKICHILPPRCSHPQPSLPSVCPPKHPLPESGHSTATPSEAPAGCSPHVPNVSDGHSSLQSNRPLHLGSRSLKEHHLAPNLQDDHRFEKSQKSHPHYALTDVAWYNPEHWKLQIWNIPAYIWAI